MENVSKLLTALATLAWPFLVGLVIYRFSGPLAKLIESARGRKFSIKIGGNELSMEEASEQQQILLIDLQQKIAKIEHQLSPAPEKVARPQVSETSRPKSQRILWVDDQPKNNSYYVAALEANGTMVETALSTQEGLERFKSGKYDVVITDMGRPEGKTAGIDLVTKLRAIDSNVPIYVFCGAWASANLRDESVNAGATEITSSGTTLLSLLVDWPTTH